MSYGIFTPEMKKTHTVLVPGMLAIHFRLFPARSCSMLSCMAMR